MQALTVLEETNQAISTYLIIQKSSKKATSKATRQFSESGNTAGTCR